MNSNSNSSAVSSGDEYTEDDFASYDTLTYTDDFDLSGEEDGEDHEPQPYCDNLIQGSVNGEEKEFKFDPDDVNQAHINLGIQRHHRKLLQRGLRSLKDIAYLRSVVDRAFITRSHLRRGLRRLQISVATKQEQEFKLQQEQQEISSNQTTLKRWKQILK